MTPRSEPARDEDGWCGGRGQLSDGPARARHHEIGRGVEVLHGALEGERDGVDGHATHRGEDLTEEPIADDVEQLETGTLPRLHQPGYGFVDDPRTKRPAEHPHDRHGRVEPVLLQGGRPKSVAVEVPERAAHRVAHPHAAAETVGIRERGEGPDGPPRCDPVGKTGTGVLFGHEEGHSSALRRQCRRDRDVAPHAEHGPDFPALDDLAHRPGSPEHHQGQGEIRRAQRSAETSDLDPQEVEPLRRVDDGLHAVAAHVQDVRSGDSPVDQRLPHGEPGEHVAPRAGCGDDEGHLRASTPAWAMLTRIPSDAMETINAVIPYETNGRAMPVIGKTPSTPPMLTSAWNEIQAVRPAAIIRPKESGARAATIHPVTAMTM